MDSRVLIGIAGFLAVVGTTAPVRADHNAAPPPDRSATLEVPGGESSLDIDLRLGLKSFRLGTRIFGREGYAGGAWLNGEARPDGFSLDGRLERDGKAHNFKFNADVDEWLRRAVQWWRGSLDL
jgi:hypothetical protein